MSAIVFNARNVQPMDNMEAMPTAWYKVVISESEIKETNAKTGHLLELVYTVIEGQFSKRKLFDRVNIDNPNPVAVEIGHRQLSSICHAVNVYDLQDSTQLHNIPFMVRAVYREAGKGADGKQYDATNEIKGYKPVEGSGNQNWAASQSGAAGPGWNIPPQTTSFPPQQNMGAMPQASAPPPMPGLASWQQQPAVQQTPPAAQQQMPPFMANSIVEPPAQQQPQFQPQQPAPTGVPPWANQQPPVQQQPMQYQPAQQPPVQQPPLQQAAPPMQQPTMQPQPQPAAGEVPPWAR